LADFPDAFSNAAVNLCAFLGVLMWIVFKMLFVAIQNNSFAQMVCSRLF